ncbi:bifunctional UDP-N-acetylglucosamine diphosphorylase/glucosamine-1-phosphate N-acetyltransferase GlmU [Microbacterium azadirachtae]|uniref:bifunctional UDP-N-acetylglucosamine diphosphorylase/glucosamine-1-phosphate N-acetyltransferase GlmU n=1 Tax=Microbacterium azadirachtae TaxID=582680 RepID=UPI0008802048|nr:bifunctional UDP-N-acetylglucosamine diphosphorylase/glucosamine-1-phosphate N-acetyltransferase GlmU [Microbacterium azadirachtae]SDM30095.1 UDP-N-acetylglucosamine pyrophosphorylase /glucosamine-1-phosphate N-acetyltransferase [Microbacterium azadirachtae]SEG47547.1 UDP-N-acetylglucosamine pyrophosphorylase /glucosamine-1-phosphate N-acetyltransferase [Microbacterium azadirachtae]SEG52171.1 UDP-N-acetylglucosamine pyrophosphorylase /glucosamine-1-phosphate N-acetyltransferase [Microbacteriu
MTQNALAIIVLAAGQGTRMKSRLPKVLHPIGGRTLVGHVLATASRLGAETVEVVVRHERDQVVAALASEHPDAVIVDQDEIPGTGRAVQIALDALPSGFDGDVLVLSGDVPLLEEETLQGLVDAHRAAAAAATVLSAIVDDPTGYGRIIRDEAGDVARIVEQKDADDAEKATREINAGVYVFRAGLLRAELAQVTTDNAQGEMYLTTVIGLLREHDQKVAVEIAADTAATFGINDRIQLAEAARTLNDRIVRRWQREGVSIQDPATTWIDDDVTLAPDVTILPNTHILRASTVATGAVIGPDTTLVSTEVGEDAEVRRSEATLAVIGARATVGPFSYLRAGTTLGEGGKIGAYVETKNAQIGDDSKVPHLSYVGDATVGRGVNLGASTITANYDDVNKHRTEIGDEVHTGSHTVLVAPVRLGAGAKTGAGAVVRKDVPAGALAMSVAPQRNIEGWVQKNRAGTAAADAARADSAE